MSLLAKVAPGQTEPPEVVPVPVPEECPRCGVSLEHALREVNLTLTLDDGAELETSGYECAACGWICAPAV